MLARRVLAADTASAGEAHLRTAPQPGWQLLQEQAPKLCAWCAGQGALLPSLPECEDIAEEYWEEMLQEKEKTKEKLGTNFIALWALY